MLQHKLNLLAAVLVFSTRVRGVIHDSQTNENCKGDTVDVLGSDVAMHSRNFLDRLQAAVRADKKKQVATMVEYPVKVFVGRDTRLIKNSSVFVREYDQIITGHVRRMILDQSSKCLFGNVNGFMVGDGEVWFREHPKNIFKIVSINTNEVSK
jgi:hypothetical protein